MSDDRAQQGFSDAERAAMKQRAAELKQEGKGAKGSAKREREAHACVEAIAALEGSDRLVAECLHAVVAEVAPGLEAKTWYGFPSYARDGKVVVFFQPKAKFGTRYGTIGFSDEARLDDGVIWASSFAVLDVTDEVETQLKVLVAQAAG